MNSRSLIMCVTPLQMLIAEKIIELNSDESFDLLVLALIDNEKYKHYYHRLKQKCINSLYIVRKTRLRGFTDYIKELKDNGLSIQYQNVYLASIDSRHFQYIVSKNKSANLYTFDDGTANIIPSDAYYLNSKPKLLKRIVWRFFGLKYYMKDLKNLSILHYTIYKDIPNIIENKEYLPLFPDNNNNNNNNSDTHIVSFYLGQPLTDISKGFDFSYVESNISKLEIDYYYPHPRESVYPKGNYQLVESPLIFEDYIVEFLVNNPNTNIEVFSFISTALLNIMSLDRVSVNYIHDAKIFELHQDFYNLAYDSFGVNHIDLDG